MKKNMCLIIEIKKHNDKALNYSGYFRFRVAFLQSGYWFLCSCTHRKRYCFCSSFAVISLWKSCMSLTPRSAVSLTAFKVITLLLAVWNDALPSQSETFSSRKLASILILVKMFLLLFVTKSSNDLSKTKGKLNL